MRYIFGDCELLLVVGDLLSAKVDVIVNPASAGFEHSNGLSREITQQAGDAVLRESEQLLREYGELESGMALYTSAGSLSYRAIIHATTPVMGEGDEQRKLELAISRSMQLCELNEWASIAFPAFSGAETSLPAQLCAEALFRAITRFWDARNESPLRKVNVCLAEEEYTLYSDVMNGKGVTTQDEKTEKLVADEERVGYVDLSGENTIPPDDEIDGWFK